MAMNHQAQDKPFANEGYELMAAAFEVHSEIGGGLLEEIYQEALEIELDLRDIPFQSKQELKVIYKGHLLNKTYVPDLVVHAAIIVELKAVKEIAPEHEAQLMNYMRITKCPVGYLINFGPINKVGWKRYILSEFTQETNRPADER